MKVYWIITGFMITLIALGIFNIYWLLHMPPGVKVSLDKKHVGAIVVSYDFK